MNWCEENVKLLIELYPNLTNYDISKKMNTTIKSIISKANRLGLKKSKAHKSDMISKRNKITGTDITKELMIKTALKYKTRSEFQSLDASIYTTARISGLLDEICKHMIKSNYSIPQLTLWYLIIKIFENDEVKYNTYGIIPPYEIDVYISSYKLAIEYDGSRWHKNNKNDLIKDKLLYEKNIKLIRITENNRDYINDIKAQLINNKILKKILNVEEKLSNIKKEEVYKFINDNINDINDIKEIIKKYKIYSDFINNERSLYFKLINRGLLEEMTSNLKRNRIKWTDDLIIEEVSKYNKLSEFIKNSNPCYLYCKRNKKEKLLIDLKRKNITCHK